VINSSRTIHSIGEHEDTQGKKKKKKRKKEKRLPQKVPEKG